MKLIIAGASGFVATEILRQSLRRPGITAVVALTRRAVDVPQNADVSKLKVVVIKDYDDYSEEAKKEFAGAGACIWTIAITPSRLKDFPFEEVKRVCHDCTMAGLAAMHGAGLSKPFRFLYMSGVASRRDPTQQPMHAPLAEYSDLRGETENQVLAFAAQHAGEVEACVAKPGTIEGVRKELVDGAFVPKDTTNDPKPPSWLPTIKVEELAAAMLDQVMHGFEKEPLENADLERLGKAALAENYEA